MTSDGRNGGVESKRLTLGVLAAAERGGPMSQRRLASELGVALGLVNAYVKRCIRKGHLKVSQAPAKRYRYYLTPAGFAEKARLTAEYLSDSLSFFRKARRDYQAVMVEASRRGWKHVALVGLSDLSEIAVLCAMEHDITITAVIEPHSDVRSFVGIPVTADLWMDAANVDGVIITTFDTRMPWIIQNIHPTWGDRVLSVDLLTHEAAGEANLVIA